MRNRTLNSFDISDFLRENGVIASNNDIKLLISSYDGDKDGKLDYREFERMVLPHTDAFLKDRSLLRPEEFVGMRDKLYEDIEFSLSRLIRDEIDGLKILNYKRQDLKGRYDYSRYECFSECDVLKLRSLQRQDIKEFINKTGEYCGEQDADQIVCRIDKDHDSRITYSEFCDFLDEGEQSQNMSQSLRQST